MFELYFTEQSITYLVQLILSLVITLYLLSIGQKSRSTWYLTGYFVGLTSISFFSLLESMIIGVLGYYALQLLFVGLFLALAALLQFAYAFTEPVAQSSPFSKEVRGGREYQLISALSLLIIFFVVARVTLSLYQFQNFGIIIDQTSIYVQLMIFEFIWAMLVLLRRTVRLSTHQGAWWRAFIKPEGKAAKATYAFALMLIIPVLMSTTVILEKVIISPTESAIIRTLGSMAMFLGLVIVYLNYTFERTSIMVKLVAISLTTILAVLGVIGLLIAPLLTEHYPYQALPMQQTIHFEPTEAGGFTVSEQAFEFDAQLGQALRLEDDDSQVVALPFAFPFYEQQWREMYINSDGVLSFGHELLQIYFGFDPDRYPAILAMGVDLNPAVNGQVFFKSEAEQVVVTWYEVGEFDFPHNLNTFQVVLYPNGAFEMSYDNLKLESPYKPLDHHEAHLFGVVPGGSQPTRLVNFLSDLPLVGQAGQGIIQDYETPYRRYLHQYYAPLFKVIIGGSLFLIFGFPLFFRTNLIQPLNALVEGVKEVNRGQLDVTIPAMYSDEIGFLTTSFNAMVLSIKESKSALEEINSELEERVTERTKQLSQSNLQLRQAMESAEQAQSIAEYANQAKSDFLSNMSHELRTPLNGILGYAQILKRTPDLSAPQSKGIEIIYQSGHHLLTLINDILDLSKIEARKMELYPTEVHLSSFLESVVAVMRIKAEEKEILFVYEPDAALPIGVQVDEKRLRQVLLNLLGNAIKFTHKGQVTLNVSHHAPLGGHHDATLRFEVIDTGVGMTSEQLEQIFLPFEQVGDVNGRAQGTGLGLAITRQLVRLMGGEVEVRSQLGEGSRFWFDLSLPVVTVVQKSHPEKRREHIIGYEGPKQHILVVDDRAENRFMLRDLLKPLGFEITEAENGLQEVALARRQQPDLILTDIMMPLMNGFEAVKEIRQFAPKLPIIAISASLFALQGDENIEQKQSLRGCDAFLPKPVDTTKLLELIEAFLPLQWIYEQNAHTPKLPPNLLIAPPPEELATLHELATLGMMSGIRKQAAHLEDLDANYTAFANKLRELARRFEDDKILALIEQHLPDS